MHPDYVGGVTDGDAESIGRVLSQDPAKVLLDPDQQHGKTVFSGSRNRSLNIDRRAAIASHRVKSYASSHMSLPTREREGLGLLPLHDFAAAIVPAGRTGAMGKFPLMTVGAFGQIGDGESIVGATLPRSGIAVPPLWKRHP